MAASAGERRSRGRLDVDRDGSPAGRVRPSGFASPSSAPLDTPEPSWSASWLGIQQWSWSVSSGEGAAAEPVETVHPHLAATGLTLDSTRRPAADAVFLALPHGAAVERVPALVETRRDGHRPGRPTSGSRIPPTIPAGIASSMPGRTSWRGPSTACPSSIGPSWSRSAGRPVRIVGSPGCYATASILALAPLARAGLLGDVVVDAKSGVSGAGRDPRPDLHVRRGQRERPGLRRRRPPSHRRDRAGAVGLAAPGAANPGANGHRFPAPPDPDDPGHPRRGPRPAGAADEPGRARRAVRERLRRRAVRVGGRRASGDEARDRQQRGPDPRLVRPADRAGSSCCRCSTTWSRAPPGRRSSPSTSSTGWPRRPASNSFRWRHDRRPGPVGRSPARREGDVLDALPPDLPSVDRLAVLPGGFAAGATGGRDQGQRTARPGRRSGPPTVRRLRRQSSPSIRSPRRRSGPEPGPPPAHPSARARAATAGPRRSSRRRVAPMPRPARPGLADQVEIGRLLAAAAGVPAERTLHLSTGIIGTRLPIDRIAAGLSSARPGRILDTDAGLGGRRRRPAHHRLADEGGEHGDRPAGGRRTHRAPGHGQRLCQGCRDDPSGHGHDAVGDPDRRPGRACVAPRPPSPGRRSNLEPAHRGRRHEHERHGLRAGLRGQWHGRRSAPGRTPPGSWAGRSRPWPATWPASRRPTARGRRRS